MILKYSEFINEKLGNKFYHFSESALKPGDILKSKICDNQVYLDRVMPVYREVAKEHGFEWPICHGYCFTEPKFIYTGDNIESFKENDLKNTICYEIIADADIHIGAIDRSAMYTTMLLEGKTYVNIETYARQYFMNPPTTYKEAICSRFRVIGPIERSEWTVEKPSIATSLH
jgi:hypothetical protein